MKQKHSFSFGGIILIAIQVWLGRIAYALSFLTTFKKDPTHTEWIFEFIKSRQRRQQKWLNRNYHFIQFIQKRINTRASTENDKLH